MFAPLINIAKHVKPFGRFLLLAFGLLAAAVTMDYVLQDYDTSQRTARFHYSYLEIWRIALHAPVDMFESLHGPLKHKN